MSLLTIFEKARRGFRSEPVEQPAPEPYEITCPCGQVATGVRSERRQFRSCKCGAILFVLPISPFPQPKPRKPKKPPKPPEEKLPERKPVPGNESPGGGTKEAPKPPAQPGERQQQETPRQIEIPRRPFFTRGKLIGLGILVMIFGTGYIVFQSTGRDQLTDKLRDLETRWTGAIEQGEISLAREHLDDAANLLSLYGGQDSASGRMIIQLHKEVTLLDELPESEPATMPSGESNPAIVLDLFWDGSQDDEELPTLLFGLEFVSVDLSRLQLVRSLDSKLPSRIILGARVEEITFTGKTLVLLPESGVLITSPTLLEELGWEIDDSLRETLERQQQWRTELIGQ